MANYSIDKEWETETIYLYEGHSWGSWRHTFDDMMEFFFTYTGNYEDDSNTEPPPDDEGNNKIIGPSSMIILGLISITSISLINRKKKF